MTILWRLLFGHFLADFALQSNFINDWKRSGTWGMLTHCGIHLGLYTLLCWPFLNDVWIDLGFVRLQGWTCMLLIFLLHYIEDIWRVFTIQRHGVPDNTPYFLWDQTIHVVCIMAFVPTGLYEPTGMMPERWPVLGCLAVLVAHFGTVLLYFIEHDLFGGSYPDFDEKYLTMIERLGIAACFLLPGFWGFAAPAAWAGAAYAVREKGRLDYSWTGFYLGAILAVVAGLAARWVWYS
ncbi:MAG: DUF3307 domain-containing protein [Elusimicrobiota bacterium]